MGPFALLIEEHRRIDELLRDLEDTSARAVATRARNFMELVRLLSVHTAGEEEAVYPYLQDAHAERMRHAYEEHHRVDVAIDELRNLDPDDASWEARVHVLREMIAQHVREEEDELIPTLRRMLDEDQSEELTYDMEEARDAATRWLDEHPDASAQAATLARSRSVP